MNMSNQEYDRYIKEISPPSKHGENFFRAFLMGGLICALGEGILRLYIHLGMERENAFIALAITLIFFGALLTGLGVYDKLAQIGKAGALVPITGFSNAVTSPAIEFKQEGYVLGLCAKLFSIAGPVLVYGTIASTLFGIAYLMGLGS